ncbi:hypothetical protein BHE74_00009615 [Ensete ventricosum]|nr:hypothetical protein GW17_00039740 [Ensete ventricosum]RWW81944.1 hypothetical protein BHE74_00009615 [Ensete ventricosum]RZR91357.1 hypothetical protein BHM03_00019468 [Ensete ventricosum]
MASLSDIGVSAAINLLSALAFLVAFAVLRLQPINDRVYFSKWYLKGIRSSPTRSGTFVHKFVNLNLRLYLKFLEWMPAALKMPEPELIDHAGLDSAVFLRIYLIGYSTYVSELCGLGVRCNKVIMRLTSFKAHDCYGMASTRVMQVLAEVI